tara:strand:+ start:526 stop:768 length:243 start_codon:yes stop_codon:yes gene_type:complete
MIKSEKTTNDSQGEAIEKDLFIISEHSNEEHQSQRIHGNSLVPAHGTWDELHHLAKEQATDGCQACDQPCDKDTIPALTT